MNDFLQFLNTTDVDSLTKIPGISETLAENLVAARPFETTDDCLKVRGMGKNLFARLQSSFNEMEKEKETNNRALIPVEQKEEELESTSVEKIPPKEETRQMENKPSFSSRLGQAVLWFFRALLRLILIVLLIGGVGAAIYYGVPFLNEKFITPLEQNTTRVNELESQISSLQVQLYDINSQLTEINNQLNETNNRVDGIQQSIDAQATSLATLTEMQAVLEAQLKEGNSETLLALKNEILMTRILDTLARARLYLAQSNFGLAKEDVQSARDLVSALQAESKDEALTQAAERLDLTLANLPNFPVVASGDLEIAWQILMTGQTVATSTPATETPTITPAMTLEATPGVTATP